MVHLSTKTWSLCKDFRNIVFLVFLLLLNPMKTIRVHCSKRRNDNNGSSQNRQPFSLILFLSYDFPFSFLSLRYIQSTYKKQYLLGQHKIDLKRPVIGDEALAFSQTKRYSSSSYDKLAVLKSLPSLHKTNHLAQHARIDCHFHRICILEHSIAIWILSFKINQQLTLSTKNKNMVANLAF